MGVNSDKAPQYQVCDALQVGGCPSNPVPPPVLGSLGWPALCRAPAGNSITVRVAGLKDDVTHGCLWSEPGHTSCSEMTLEVQMHLTAGQGSLFRTPVHSMQRLLGMRL